MLKRIISIFCIFIFLTVGLFAQSDRVAGKIRGRVLDKNGGFPLVGANVIVIGTSRGCATNVNGEFLITNIPAGKHDVRVTYIGYSSFRFQGVEIFPGQSKTLNFDLEVQAVEGEAVEVVADARKSVVAVRAPTAQKELTSEEIGRMPVSDFNDVLASASGAIETEGGRARGIHLRGGRSGEVAFFVDGVMTNDPVDHSAGLEIDNSAIDQIVISSGGFSAEYGEAMSGVVTIITKGGRKTTTHAGTIEYESDRFPSQIDSDLDFGYNKYHFNIRGPIPFTNNNGNYFLSLSTQDASDRNPRPVKQTHNSEKNPSGTLKLAYRPEGSAFKVTVDGSFSDNDQLLYNHGISKGNWLQSYYNREDGHRRLSLKFQGTASKNTFWYLLTSYYDTYSNFSSGEGASYKDFSYISTRLKWVNEATNNGWYDPKTREWEALIDDNGANMIKDYYLTPDGENLQNSSFEDQAFYYHYATLGYYDLSTGTWSSPEDEVAALNRRSHDAHHWYIPSELDEESQWYDANDNTAHLREFDTDDYNEYLYSTNDEQKVIDLYGYYGDFHNGYYWDRDLFNVFTYGPGRPRFHEQKTKLYTTEFNINSQINIHNDVKFGWKWTYGNLHYMDVQFANNQPYFDKYDYKPVTGALWIEDKFEYEDLIVSFGTRFDYFHSHANTIWDFDNVDCGSDGLANEFEDGYDIITNPDPAGDNYDAVNNPDGSENDGEIDRKMATPKIQTSPRLGISFAVSDKTAMYANYGHFFQVPALGSIYQNLYMDISTGYPLVGNPDVEPEHTTSYELGLKHTLAEGLGLEVALYYKDVDNLTATRTYNLIYEGTPATVTYNETVDFAKIKGAELKFKMKHFMGFNGELSYTYQDAKGTGSSSREFYENYFNQFDRPLPAKEYPLEYDITHSFKGNLGYYLPEKFGPTIFGMKPFQRFSIYGNSYFYTGRPYTPSDKNGKMLEIGSKRMPSNFRVDMQLEKYFKISKSISLSFYVDIRNLFNTLNIASVYTFSGEADDPGRPPAFERSRYMQYVGHENPITGALIKTPEQAYDIHMQLRKELFTSPFNYGAPRQIRLGFTLTF